MAAEVFGHSRGVLHLLDVVMGVVQGVIEGQGLELVLGEDPGDLALEGEVEGEPAAAGVGQEHPSRLEVTPEPGRFVVGPVELVVTGHVQERIAHGLRVLGPDVHLLELDGQRRVVAHVLQQVMDRRGVGVPVAVVDELGEDEIVAAGGRRPRGRPWCC